VATELLTKEEHRVSPAPVERIPPAGDDRARRLRRLKLNAAAWSVGSALVTALWVLVQWSDNGSFQSFGHEGDTGQWNPTLWALVVGLWGLVVGIMALGVYFAGHRWRFHAAAWALGMVVLTPLWALLEWQDNGAFERWSNNSRPGDWDPWILTVGAVWALAIGVLALWTRRRSLDG
jgi:hypothetical protein